jgi:hypothetical protein
MIKIISKTVMLILVILLAISCSTEETLQKYYVDSENKSDILMLDIAPSSLLVLEDNVSAEAKQALNSIDKLNVLAFKLNDKNGAAYNEEKAKVTQILGNKSYQELFALSDNGNNVVVKFLGSDESMDEVIVYGSNPKKGFALGRLIGNDMKPENMIKLIENIQKMNSNSEAFKSIESFFKVK